ncbi:MAG: hypothetical protein ACRDJE_03550 [Dehalococcoidia bacterium]
MPRMSDLWRLLEEDPRLREDFISILGSFFERHSIEVSPEDLQGADDVVGLLFSAHLAPSPPTTSPMSETQMKEPPPQARTEQTISTQEGGSDDDNP